MASYQGEIPLIIESTENNLEVRNYMETDDKAATPFCKLHDFFSNNINFELNKISILRLENCDLHDIPLNVQKLNLKQLILTRNKLREVPSCLYSGLNSLKLLDLSFNSIKNFDVEPACRCTIVTLKLNNNKIHNLPHWILNLSCPNLAELIYSNNQTSDLRAFHKINVKKLEMCNCQLLDVDFPFFRSLRDLEHLNISNDESNYHENNFRNVDQLFFKIIWKNLQSLNLSNITISILSPGVFWITSLKELYLTKCDLSWIPSDVRYLSNLKILDVSDNTICSLPAELIYLNNLVIIKAANNNISIVAEFTQTIEILDLYNNWLEAYPACVSSVKCIDLEQNYFETGENYDYEYKRDQLRKLLSLNRKNGSRELPEVPFYEDNQYTSYSESENSDYEYNDYVTESDNWDEAKPVILSKKNPEITTSDDEWEGKEEIRKCKQTIKQVDFDIEEEWIFCDAEEE